MRRLIVNADDFGLTPGVNRAIAEAHQRGIVTSATLMANSESFDDAIRMAKASPHWSIGCHVVLLDGSPLMDPDRLGSLVRRKNGRSFRDGIGGLAVRALTGWIDSDEVQAEVTAQ
ncbi:MAG TPA: ChbG/HpnK family deacetylase, partial [Terriglobales bacterium]|nr:ChbG/HpnK family deacetylase [Terriglobales bacterium]